MFIPLKYGLERTPIGTGEYPVRCPHCETHQWAEILVFSVYTHLYYIPLYPTDKDAMVQCKKCGLKRYGVPLNEKLVPACQEMKKQYRHRWFTYTGVAILSLIFLVPLLYALFK